MCGCGFDLSTQVFVHISDTADASSYYSAPCTVVVMSVLYGFNTGFEG